MDLFDFDLETPAEQAPPPVPRDDAFSLLPVQDRLAAFQAVAQAMVAEAQAMVVHDDDTAKRAVALAAKAKKKAREIEAARKEIVAPHNDFVAAVNRLAKDCAGPLAQVEAILKKKINEHETRVRLELAKAQEAARQEAARLQAEIEKQAQEAGVQPPVVVTPVLPEAPGPIRTEAGSASQRREWTFEIVDPMAVPREYLMINEKEIRAAVKRGIREIPGVRIYEETKTVIRA